MHAPLVETAFCQHPMSSLSPKHGLVILAQNNTGALLSMIVVLPKVAASIYTRQLPMRNSKRQQDDDVRHRPLAKAATTFTLTSCLATTRGGKEWHVTPH